MTLHDDRRSQCCWLFLADFAKMRVESLSALDVTVQEEEEEEEDEDVELEEEDIPALCKMSSESPVN